LSPSWTCGGRLTAGAGQEHLRVLEVEHEGNAAASIEEVVAVAALRHHLVGGRFIDRHGVARAMTAADVLVVTPYNDQVGLLLASLPGARIGTVDTFQARRCPW